MTFDDAHEVILEFIAFNNLRRPSMIIDDPSCMPRHYGIYDPYMASIHINSTLCGGPTGDVDDTSVFGTIAHELGHHWDHTFDGNVRRSFAITTKDEEMLSRYERRCCCVGESIAEAFRLFVTNPELLAELRPKRYEFLKKKGLRCMKLEF